MACGRPDCRYATPSATTPGSTTGGDAHNPTDHAEYVHLCDHADCKAKLPGLVAGLRTELAEARQEKNAWHAAHGNIIRARDKFRTELYATQADLAAALKREGEARDILQDIVEVAVSQEALMREYYAFGNDKGLFERARNCAFALAPVPTAPPTHPNDCVCPYPRTLCPACDNPCRACRYASPRTHGGSR